MLSAIFYTALSLCNLLLALLGVLLLPETVATHFSLQGVVDGMGSPAVYLALPAAAALISAAVWVAEARLRRLRTPVKGICFAVGAVLVYVGWILFSLISDGVGPGETVRFPSAVAVGLPFSMLYIACGVSFFRLRPNSLFGIRTSATGKDDMIWAKTHRFGGILFVAAGVLSFLVCIAASNLLSDAIEPYLLLVPLALMAAAGLIPMYYAHLLARQKVHKEKEQYDR